LFATVSALAAGSLPTAKPGAPTLVPDPVIGSVAGQPVTERELIAADGPEFEHLESDFESERHRLEIRAAQARHDLLARELDKLLDRRALELEAKARGVEPATVLAELKPVTPSESELHAFYAQNQQRIQKPYEAVAEQIRGYLGKQQNDAAARQFYDALRARHGVIATLEPFRIAVAADGPARGKADAPVTIVEFGDFECPYCRKAESTLRDLLEKHPDDVRLVFRNFPLERIHPNAVAAAEAAVCAASEGKFWEMHDALYGDGGNLALNGLVETAGRIGLDPDRFRHCITNPATTHALDGDRKAAVELGLSGTPYFFVNGRPIDGNVPIEQFESLISDELRHRAAAASHARG
jgi:protein-disulfide isomerase